MKSGGVNNERKVTKVKVRNLILIGSPLNMRKEFLFVLASTSVTLSAAFAGPMVGGGPPNVGRFLECYGQRGSSLMLHGPQGQTGLYASELVREELSCGGTIDRSIACRNSDRTQQDLRISIQQNSSNEIVATVFLNGDARPVDALSCVLN